MYVWPLFCVDNCYSDTIVRRSQQGGGCEGYELLHTGASVPWTGGLAGGMVVD